MPACPINLLCVCFPLFLFHICLTFLCSSDILINYFLCSSDILINYFLFFLLTFVFVCVCVFLNLNVLSMSVVSMSDGLSISLYSVCLSCADCRVGQRVRCFVMSAGDQTCCNIGQQS